MPSKSPSEYFAAPAWEPVCTVGSHSEQAINAQICVSIVGASIVPDRPRLLVMLWKTNYTHDLVRAAGTLAITLLSEGQLDLLEPLGLHSGRDLPGGLGKLDMLETARTANGDPYFSRGVGYLDGAVLDAYDLGDCTCFLVAVRQEQRLSDAEPMTWAHARELAGPDFLERYDAKFELDQSRARETMRWLGQPSR